MSNTKTALFVSAAMLITAPAFAQTAAPGSTAPSAGTSSSAQTNAAAANLPPLDTSSWTQQERPGEWRASKLRGLNVYNAGNEKIGEIEELMVKTDGSVDLAVISVGGFLGLGEHYVAVPFKSLMFTDSQRRPVAVSTMGAPGTTAGTTAGTAGTVGAPDTTASTTNRPATSAGASTAMGNDLPDRALLNATKDQLKSAPQFRYSRS